MRFENSFDVDAAVDEVWDTLLDVERVAPTVPGAQVLERIDDDAYKVAIKVKVGPMSMTYRGEVEITERDASAHRAVMRARAKESRGQGTANADVTMQLSGDDGHTSASVVTDVELSGKVATMGQGVLQDVSGRLVETFAKNLAAMLAGGGPAEVGAPARPGLEEERAGGPTIAAAVPPVEAAAERRQPAEGSGGMAGGRPAPAAEPAEALDLGTLGGAVIAARLQDPRRLAGLLAAVALVAYLVGRRAGRR